MPQPFYDCVKRGGKVRTRDLGDRKYIHICFIDGKSYPGEVKEKKTVGENRDNQSNQHKKNG